MKPYCTTIDTTKMKKKKKYFVPGPQDKPGCNGEVRAFQSCSLSTAVYSGVQTRSVAVAF
jgi:hypothetical protein